MGLLRGPGESVNTSGCLWYRDSYFATGSLRDLVGHIPDPPPMEAE